MRPATPERDRAARRAPARPRSARTRRTRGSASGPRCRSEGSDRADRSASTSRTPRFGLTCCAERVALFAAVAAGHRELTAIAVHAGRRHRRRPAAPAARCWPSWRPTRRSSSAATASWSPRRSRSCCPSRSRCERRRRTLGPDRAGGQAERREVDAGQPAGRRPWSRPCPRRPQTTRRRALGAVTRGDAQLVLVDLPGFQTPFDRLTERMQRSVDETLADADVPLLVLDATEPIGRRRPLRRRPRDGRGRAALRDRPEQGRPAAAARHRRGDRRPRPRSARSTPCTRSARSPATASTRCWTTCSRCSSRARPTSRPAPPPTRPTSSGSPRPCARPRSRSRATRCRTPSAVAGGRDRAARRATRIVHATLICETESQKGILIGKGGAMIKRIGSDAAAAGRADPGRPGATSSCGSRCAATGAATRPSSTGSACSRLSRECPHRQSRESRSVVDHTLLDAAAGAGGDRSAVRRGAAPPLRGRLRPRRVGRALRRRRRRRRGGRRGGRLPARPGRHRGQGDAARRAVADGASRAGRGDRRRAAGRRSGGGGPRPDGGGRRARAERRTRQGDRRGAGARRRPARAGLRDRRPTRRGTSPRPAPGRAAPPRSSRCAAMRRRAARARCGSRRRAGSARRRRPLALLEAGADRLGTSAGRRDLQQLDVHAVA